MTTDVADVPELHRTLGDDVPGWDVLRAEWDELADRLGAGPFMRPGWFELWRSAFDDGSGATLTVRRSGRLVAVVPLLQEGTLVESMANDHTPAFDVLAEDPEALSAIVGALFGLRARKVTLEYLDSAGDALSALRRAAPSSGYIINVREWERPPFVDVTGTWETYEQTVDTKLRRDLARRRRRLEQLGAVTFDVQDGTTRLDELLEEGFALEGSGWKDARGTAIRSRPHTRDFYTGVAAWAAARGLLRLSYLRVDGRPVAFQLGLEDKTAFYFLKGGYEPAYSRFAPAKLLVQAQLERVFIRPVERFEFLGPPEPFKLEWTSTCHDLRRFEAFRRTPVGLVGWSAEAFGRPAARRARTLVARARATRSASVRAPQS